ncbi:MAG: hypothetical protein EBR82_43075 [Caulobacteraceae bacterium]|nr:hypothetical protein [Caulobacteraceae bacterium]
MGQTGMHGIAVMNSGNGIMDDANARLIAAAPELLAVVEKLLAVPANQIGDVLMLIPAARAAIAKATGRE